MSENSLDRFKKIFADITAKEPKEEESVDASTIITGKVAAQRKEMTFEEKTSSLKEELSSQDLSHLKDVPKSPPIDTKTLIQETISEVHRNNFGDTQPVVEQEVVAKEKEEIKEEKVEETRNIIEEMITEKTEEISEEKNAKESEQVAASVPISNVGSNYLDNQDESNKEEWDLESPNPRFDDFYSQKAKLIRMITPGGRLPFDEWNQELLGAHVDISSSYLYDTNAIYVKMEAVQQWRERIQEIILKTNRQYYIWKRAIELLAGNLARIHYEKPAEKQKGVIHQYMLDAEVYFGNLEALKENVQSVMKNLDGAFECLSRQLTASQDKTRVPTIYEKDKVFTKTPIKKEDLEGFDSVNIEQPNDLPDDKQKLGDLSSGWGAIE